MRRCIDEGFSTGDRRMPSTPTTLISSLSCWPADPIAASPNSWTPPNAPPSLSSARPVCWTPATISFGPWLSTIGTVKWPLSTLVSLLNSIYSCLTLSFHVDMLLPVETFPKNVIAFHSSKSVVIERLAPPAFALADAMIVWAMRKGKRTNVGDHRTLHLPSVD